MQLPMDATGNTARAARRCISAESGPDNLGSRPASAMPLARVFEQAGTVVRLARHQQLTISWASDDCSYLVHSGTIALETLTSARYILGFWHAGDLLETAQMPALPELALRAVEGSELWRLRQTASKPLFTESADVRAAYQKASATTLKRMMIASTMLARLEGGARVVSFLTSIAMRLGEMTGNRVTLRMPMSRADIADHLGLNPDTVSRIVTSLKDAGLIESHGRHGLIIRDWRGFSARTPLAAALTES